MCIRDSYFIKFSLGINVFSFHFCIICVKEKVETLSKKYDEKREELLSFREKTNSIIGERQDMNNHHRKLKDEVRKCEVLIIVSYLSLCIMILKTVFLRFRKKLTTLE